MIFKSATKFVLLITAISLNVITMFACIWAIIHGSLEAKNILALFGTTLNTIVGFYFGSKMAGVDKPVDPTQF